MSGEENFAFAKKLIAALYESGVAGFVVSPGFRNSPLNLACEVIAPELTQRFFDERAAGFFALGIAKATFKPAVIICTSGSAAANYFPAIVEAEQSNTPMIVITADRPRRLVGTGANQTMDQWNLFGSHVQSALVIDGSAKHSDSEIREFAHELLQKSCSGKRGPVHLNLAFEEPLLPTTWTTPDKCTLHPSAPQAADPQDYYAQALAAIRDFLTQEENIVLAVGTANLPHTCRAKLIELSHNYSLPLITDAPAGIFSTHLGNCFIFQPEDIPDLASMAEHYALLRIGPPLLHKNFEANWHKESARPVAIIDFPKERRFNRERNCLFIDFPLHELASLLDALNLEKHVSRTPAAGLANWQKQRVSRAQKLSSALATSQTLSELHFWNTLRARFPVDNSTALFVGNSMPIRDFNRVGLSTNTARIFHNRGLSGIDGLVATATGIAWAARRPIWAVLGDLSYLYDLNSLLLANGLRDKISLNLFVLNNRGGDIFRTVDTKRFPESIFVLPETENLARIAESMGIEAERVQTEAELTNACEKILPPKQGVRLFEILVSPEANRQTRELAQ